MGHLSARDSVKGALREGSWGTHKMRFLRDIQNSLKRISLCIGALLGNLEGVHLPGLLRKKYIWVPFLDLEAIKILSLGAIWSFSKGTGLS
jgi:hypothetical protein